MDQIKHYVIPLHDVSAEDVSRLKGLFEAHARLFDGAILSVYGGDIRYAVVADSFKVTDITAGKVSYLCQVNYFAPCNDQNEVFQNQGSAHYSIVENEIILELDETLWNIN